MERETSPPQFSDSLLAPSARTAGPPIDATHRRAPPNSPRQSMQEVLAFTDDSPPAIANISQQTRRAIHRLRPPVKAHGGKYYLAREIVPILLGVRERVTEYLEPCAFGASVFLAMPRLQREILGDINPDVCALWTVLGNESLAAALTDRLSILPYNESTFDGARSPSDGTLLDSALRFLVTCRFSRGGLGKDFAWSGRERGGKPGDANAWDTFRSDELPRIITRARGVEVTSQPCWWTVWQSRAKIHRLIYADTLCGGPHNGSSVAHSVMWRPARFLGDLGGGAVLDAT